jgi:hypothetical protein
MSPFKSSFLPLFATIVSVWLICCANSSHLLGKWREIGKSATLEFLQDGSFGATDNQGMTVRGKYIPLKNGSVKFEIEHPGASTEILILKISASNDTLTIASEHPGKVERYGRMKQ